MKFKKRAIKGIALVLLMFTSCQNAFAEDIQADAQAEMIYGDADGNGILSANDAAVILSAVNEGTELSEKDFINNYDTDFSGILTANDAAAILYKVYNNAYTLPVEIEMNREIEPESHIISRWNNRSIFERDFEYGSSARVYEIKSKSDIDAFVEENPEVNKDALLEHIYNEFGRNVLANRNLIIACSVTPDIQSVYDVKDASVSDGALCITMDNILPSLQMPIVDSRLILVSVGKNTGYDYVEFTVNNYHEDAYTKEIIFDNASLWK